jgi:NTE family protein
VGIIQVLYDAKIPVQAIYATELSGIVALSFTTSKTPHEMDWKLLRFSSASFPVAKKGLMGWVGKLGSSAIEKSITQAFQDIDLGQVTPPTSLCASSADGSQCFSKGPLRKLLQASISNPSLISGSIEIDGKKLESSQGKNAFPVSSARESYRAPIVLIDTIASRGPATPQPLEKETDDRLRKERELAQSAMSEADLVLVPDLDGIGFLDFDRRQEVVFRGKKAANASLEMLRKLSGSHP